MSSIIIDHNQKDLMINTNICREIKLLKEIVQWKELKDMIQEKEIYIVMHYQENDANKPI